ncbi:RNA-directed DNA polymerase, eukaryota [Tanacetum coccineum]
MNNLESDDEAVDTPLVSPFPHSDNDSDDGEVLNELIEYENAGTLRRERIINSFDGDDLAFECMMGFRKFTAYLNPFLPMNIISRKSYNIIMVKGLEGMGKNLVSIVKDVYIFIGSFTNITDFVVLEDGKFTISKESESDNLFLDHIQGEDENVEDVQMADHLRLMEEPLRIPTYVNDEVLFSSNAIIANEFELKTELLDFIRAAETWLENEPPCSITTWDDLVSKFLNQFYPHSQTRELRKEIMNFQQVFGGNLMMRNIQEALTTIKNKARVQLVEINLKFRVVVKLMTKINKAAFQLNKNQRSQSQKDLQESPISVLAAKTTVTRSTSDELYKRGTRTEDRGRGRGGSVRVGKLHSSKSTPLIPPPETPPLSTPKSKENLEPNPHQPSIPYPSRLKEENFQALENPTGRADHFVYRIDISLLLLPTPFKDSESLLEETDTFLSQIDDCFPEYETFCFNIEEKSSGSTTSHSDLSLPDYEVFCFEEKSSGSTTSHSNHSLLEYESFCFDHIKEKSGGSTTTHPDFSLPEYDSFIFDLLIDPFPSADRSASHHEEFADELAHIISPPEYDPFYFDLEIVPGEFTRVLGENIFDLSTNGLTINELNDSSLLLSDCDSSLSKEFSEIDLLVSFPSGN